ncbi:MAG: glycosyltransferase [Candidatus Electrothrix sp. LOE2]|nr:glycosyltransferase [Candidatus Electrothrix sp. LOE2]
MKNKLITWFRAVTREKLRWRRKIVQSSNSVCVFYGYESLPTSGEIASGGIVKTQDLQNEFPNTPDRPNILYLISSALPPYAPRMAQWAKKAGAKIVLNQNGVAYPAWHGKGWETTNKFMREVLQYADHVFYQSDFCKLGADRFLDLRNDRYEILYNPVDTSFFQPAEAPLPFDPVRLLLAGSHHHFYRVQAAVDTIKKIIDSGVDAKLEIAGRFCWSTNGFNPEEELKDYIQSRSLSTAVTLSGAYSQKKARDLFRRAHLLLHTKYNDPCPRLVVEAMASGIPVVYSASGGVPELVGDKAGIGVPAVLDWKQDHPPSPDLLATAVHKILASYQQYAQAARKRAVENFDTSSWIRKHQEVFFRLIALRDR